MISYGSFAQVDGVSGSADFKVGELLGDRFREYDFTQLTAAYIEAVNAELPNGFELAGPLGKEFLGPEPKVKIDFARYVNAVDFWAVIEPYRKETQR